MSEPNPESTTLPMQTSTETIGSTSLSGSVSRISGNQGKNSNRTANSYGCSRGKQSIIAVNSADRDFRGKIERIGVLGIPIERQLKFAANLKKRNDLKPLIKFLQDSIKWIGEAPAVVDGMKEDKEKLETWKEKLSKHNRRIKLIKDNTEKLYGIMM
eukprot:10927192-Ditylum_brightwellii.AAC.1